MTAPHPIRDNRSVQTRTDMLGDKFESDEETRLFVERVHKLLSFVAHELMVEVPASCDVGRYIAGVDALRHAENLFCDAAILGAETERRQ